MKHLDLLLSLVSPTHIAQKFSVGFLDNLFGGGGGGSAPEADPNIGLAQQKMADLAKEQWSKFTTDIYPEMLKQSQQQESRANEQWAMTKDVTGTQLEQAKKAYERYEQGAIPAMEKIRADANQYNEAAYQEQLAQGARADVTSAMENQRQQQAMRQRAYGIDPTSGTAQFASNAMGANQALMEAQAMNQTRQAAKDVGLQKQANVYNMYSGLAAQGNANTGIALGSANQGFQTGQAALSNFGTTGAALNAGTQTAMSGWNNVGQLGVGVTNAANQAYAANQQANAASSAGLGNMIGTGIGVAAKLGVFSDIRMKENIVQVGMLDNGLPIYVFEYKPEFRDIAGHGPQIGVMAQEAEQRIPAAVSTHANGYKQVDYSKVVSHGI